jgi:hypothetical protein
VLREGLAKEGRARGAPGPEMEPALKNRHGRPPEDGNNHAVSISIGWSCRGVRVYTHWVVAHAQSCRRNIALVRWMACPKSFAVAHFDATSARRGADGDELAKSLHA